MPKIYCAAVECEWNKDGKCKAQTVALSANSIMTMWDGRQDFNTCKTFQKSQRATDMEKQFTEYMKGVVKHE